MSQSDGSMRELESYSQHTTSCLTTLEGVVNECENGGAIRENLYSHSLSRSLTSLTSTFLGCPSVSVLVKSGAKDNWGDLGSNPSLNLIYVNKSLNRHLKDNYPQLWEKYRSCGKKPVGFVCTDCDTRWYVPNSCGVRGCPTCGKYHLARMYRRYIPALKQQPLHLLRKVELTYGHVNGVFTDHTLRQIYRMFQQVLDTYWKTYVCGLEVSPNGSIHLHALVVGCYVSQRMLSKRAGEIYGKPVVWIRRGGRLYYMMKDIVKAPEFVTERLRVMYFEATRNLRMFRSRGGLYSLGDSRKVFACSNCGGGLVYCEVIDENGRGLCGVYNQYDGTIPPPC